MRWLLRKEARGGGIARSGFRLPRKVHKDLANARRRWSRGHEPTGVWTIDSPHKLAGVKCLVRKHRRGGNRKEKVWRTGLWQCYELRKSEGKATNLAAFEARIELSPC